MYTELVECVPCDLYECIAFKFSQISWTLATSLLFWLQSVRNYFKGLHEARKKPRLHHSILFIVEKFSYDVPFPAALEPSVVGSLGVSSSFQNLPHVCLKPYNRKLKVSA